jgi:hypothetical protein
VTERILDGAISHGLDSTDFDFFPFLNEIFSAEKCVERILGVYLDRKFWIFSIFKRNIFG